MRMVISTIAVFMFVARAILLVSAETDPQNYRLPSIFNPLHYKVHLYMNHNLFTLRSKEFSGEVEIIFKMDSSTKIIALHCDHERIKLKKVILANFELPPANYSVNAVTDILEIYVERHELIPNFRYNLVIIYTGTVSTEELYGIYKSRYVVRHGETKHILVTNLGSTYTRRVFPCFDEPGYKSTFHFIVTFPTSFNIFFSTKAINSSDDGNGLTTVHFYETPRMTVASLGLVIAYFTCTDADTNTTNLRVCSREEFASQRDLALDITPKILESLNSFTNYSYNRFVDKLDIVAVPNFPALAASSMGLHVHRETDLLSDKVESSSQYKEFVTQLTAHELSHQWFGNLLTNDWYSEIFMQEGIARFLEYYIVNDVYPEYKFDKRFIVDVLHQALAEDGTGDSSPLYVENIETPWEIESVYTTISYNKGSSIFRMVQHLMSLEKFKKGLHNFIMKYRRESSDSENLWTELNEEMLDSVPKMPANFSTIMRSWIREAGYPMVTVSLQDEVITINQSRFSYMGLDTKTKWYVPISYTDADDVPKFKKTTAEFWLIPDTELHLRFPLESKWLILNNQQTGYYRVNYDSILWGRIKDALQKEDFDGIIDINRAQIVDDLFNLARADVLTYTFVLDFVRFLKNDTSYYTWKAALNGFELLLRRVGQNTELGKAIVNDILDLMDNFYNSVPISKIKDYDHFYTVKQQLAVDWACRLGHVNCVTEAVRLFKIYKKSGRRPPVDLRNIIYCNGLRNSHDLSDWNFMWNAFLHEEKPSEKTVTLKSLGCSQSATFLKFFLQKTITKDRGISSQDAMNVYIPMIDSPVGVDVAFNFLMDNQEKVVESYKAMGDIEYIFLEIVDRLTSEKQMAKAINLISYGYLKKGFKEYGDKALFTIKATKGWLHKYSEELETYYGAPFDSQNLLWILLLIPIIVIAGCTYLWIRKREVFLDWFGFMDIGFPEGQQGPSNDIPMRERSQNEAL